MVLDEPKETDEVFNIQGFTFLMDKDLKLQTKDITVDYGLYGCGSGFKVLSEVPVGGAGGGSCSC
jgi:iron-sulfur cluster assembly protein